MSQDVIIGDASSTGSCVLWEEHLNQLECGKCYALVKFVVKEYNSAKYLSMGFDQSEIREIDDIGTTMNTEKDTTIVGVLCLDKFRTCLRCKGRVEPLSPPYG